MTTSVCSARTSWAAAQACSHAAQILASGVAMPSALQAAEMLAAEWDVAADVWSVTSWGELNRDGIACDKARLRYPDQPPRLPYIAKVLGDTAGPAVAVSDWMRAVPEQIRPWVPNTYVTLGADGFGFSDTRAAARRYFNTDAESQVVAVLEALERDGHIDPSVPAAAARQYRIDDIQVARSPEPDVGGGAT